MHQLQRLDQDTPEGLMCYVLKLVDPLWNEWSSHWNVVFWICGALLCLLDSSSKGVPLWKTKKHLKSTLLNSNFKQKKLRDNFGVFTAFGVKQRRMGCQFLVGTSHQHWPFELVVGFLLGLLMVLLANFWPPGSTDAPTAAQVRLVAFMTAFLTLPFFEIFFLSTFWVETPRPKVTSLIILWVDWDPPWSTTFFRTCQDETPLA